MHANLAIMVVELKELAMKGLEVDGCALDLHFTLPADMATHWGWFGCGGVHDPHFCHRCNAHRDRRGGIYDWAVLPECPHGDRWTVYEAASLLKVTVPDLLFLNSQSGAKERNLLEHHISFQLPPEAKKARASRNQTRADLAQEVEKNREAVEAALAKARGDQADASTFAKCTRMVGRSTAVTVGARCGWVVGSSGGSVLPLFEAPCDHDGTVFCLCAECTLPAGMRVRVFADGEMDREHPDHCMWNIAHEDCPFCTLHCTMWCTEHLLAVLQRRVIEDAGDQGVAHFNTLLKKLCVGFRIRPVRSENLSKDTTAWKPVKLNGNTAMRCVTMSSSIIDACWASLAGNSPNEDLQFKQQLHSMWNAWARVVYTMNATKPSLDQKLDFRADVRHLLRELQSTLPSNAWSGYYFHTLLHAPVWMDRFGSLGMFANQGAEAKHKEGVLAYRKGGCGGLQGRRTGAALRSRPRVSCSSGNGDTSSSSNIRAALQPQRLFASDNPTPTKGASHIPLEVLRRGIKMEAGDRLVEDLGFFGSAVTVDDHTPANALSATEFRDVKSVWESLMLLIYLRLHVYCAACNKFEVCDCGKGTYPVYKKKVGSKRSVPRVEVNSLREDWRYVHSLRSSQFELESPSSGDADGMDSRAAKQLVTVDAESADSAHSAAQSHSATPAVSSRAAQPQRVPTKRMSARRRANRGAD